MLTFTSSELERAYKSAYKSAFKAFEEAQKQNKQTNAHRLLLFYAVETGLKTVFLNRKGKKDSEGQFEEIKHDLNELMERLGINGLCLIEDIQLKSLKFPKKRQRNTKSSDLNQIWRYGAEAKQPTDEELEQQLLKIKGWIQGELKE